MTPNEARAEIARLASALLRANLAATVNTPTLSSMGQAVRVTWPAAATQPVFADLPFASIIEYRRLVLGSQFIALMTDGALIQISVDIRNDNVVGHRMCFYPCPVLVPPDFDVLSFDDLDLLLIQEFERHTQAISNGSDPDVVGLRLRSPLRFDYAPDAASASEPASHVHVLNPNARLAVHAPISIGHFVQFIFKHFYPEVWQDATLNGLSRWPLKQMDRCVSTDDERCLYLDCRHEVGSLADAQNT